MSRLTAGPIAKLLNVSRHTVRKRFVYATKIGLTFPGGKPVVRRGRGTGTTGPYWTTRAGLLLLFPNDGPLAQGSHGISPIEPEVQLRLSDLEAFRKERDPQIAALLHRVAALEARVARMGARLELLERPNRPRYPAAKRLLAERG
jgi:hypothetical protein